MSMGGMVFSTLGGIAIAYSAVCLLLSCCPVRVFVGFVPHPKLQTNHQLPKILNRQKIANIAFCLFGVGFADCYDVRNAKCTGGV